MCELDYLIRTFAHPHICTFPVIPLHTYGKPEFYFILIAKQMSALPAREDFCKPYFMEIAQESANA